MFFPAPRGNGVLIHFMHVHKKFITRVGNRRCANQVFLVYQLKSAVSLCLLARAMQLRTPPLLVVMVEIGCEVNLFCFLRRTTSSIIG